MSTKPSDLTALDKLKIEAQRLNETVQDLPSDGAHALQVRAQAAVVGQLAGDVANSARERTA